MAKRKAPSASEEFEWREKIKRLVIISLFSDNVLMERLVVKGGTALDLIHRLSTRASVDVDFSIDGDFSAEVRHELDGRIMRSLQETFRPEGYQVFDVKVEDRPPEVSMDLESFWGGYGVEFKLIEVDRYEKLKEDVEALRRQAVQLGQGSRFLIDISKHEYTAGKAQYDLDGFVVFVYSLEMMACEKLRAICQQTEEYGVMVKRNRAGSSRARDFVDIYSLVQDGKVDLATRQNLELLTLIFASKRVDVSLLRKISEYREFHRASFNAVVATVKAGSALKEFDYYFDFVIDLVARLKPLWNE